MFSEVSKYIPVNIELITNNRLEKPPKSDFCNWAIYDKLLCGPYPAKDGINFKTDEESNKNIQNILDDGITVFVNLCAELPNQENVNEEYIEIVKKHPYFPDFDYYSKFINNNKNNNIIYEYFPYQDGVYKIDKAKIVKECLIIINHIINGRKVYIHCAGGHGRTGIFVNIIYSILFNSSMEELINIFQKKHDSRKIQDKKLRNLYCVSPSIKQQLFLLKIHKYILFLKNLYL